MNEREAAGVLARLDEALHEWWDDDHGSGASHACRPVPSEDEFVAALARHGLVLRAAAQAGLDAAWAAAEAALPDGWRMLVGREVNRPYSYWATASEDRHDPDTHAFTIVSTSHDGRLKLTAADAVRELTAMLAARLAADGPPFPAGVNRPDYQPFDADDLRSIVLALEAIPTWFPETLAKARAMSGQPDGEVITDAHGDELEHGDGGGDMTAPSYIGNPHDSPIWEELSDELHRAMTKHAPMHSPHEGHSVIREELDELWEHVRADTGRSPLARKEAIEVAAMALRYVLDLIDDEPPPPLVDRRVKDDPHVPQWEEQRGRPAPLPPPNPTLIGTEYGPSETPRETAAREKRDANP